ncbi:MAG TPA: polymer-forming cytoskeletal family protein [Gammaproteobacteria bacterium]|nr:polymer-forming cytoskeletal family protein [Gammaproteobacteria bacterium]
MWHAGKKHRAEVDTLIGQQTELRGDITFSGGLHIDGKVQGNITAEGDGHTVLVLSDKGTIEGEVRVPCLVINGLVIGDLYASESIELASRARITGNVYYNRIEVAMGAEVNGSLVHMEEAAPTPSPTQDKEPAPAK